MFLEAIITLAPNLANSVAVALPSPAFPPADEVSDDQY